MPDIPNSKVNDLILNHRQMEQEIAEMKQQGIEPPYFFSINHQDQCLYYIGSKHSHAPQDEQSAFILSKWDDFLGLTETGERIAIIEGGIRATATTQDAAIIKDGEAGLVTYLAHRVGVKIISPEPLYKDQIKLLLQQFSRDEVAYYYFARIAWQWHRLTQKPPFETYAQHYADLHQQRFGWKDYDFSLPHMINLHDQTHDHQFSPDNIECFKISSNPAKSPVPNALSAYRDQSIAQAIYEIWQKGKSPFIVYGASHYVTQKPALQAILI